MSSPEANNALIDPIEVPTEWELRVQFERLPYQARLRGFDALMKDEATRKTITNGALAHRRRKERATN